MRGTPQRPEAELPEVPASSSQSKTSEKVAQVIALAVLLAAPALICVHRAAVADPDIWWHLRVGEWILQHHTVPRVEIFSGPLAGTPWLAYSWLFELVVVKLFYRLGLLGILAYTAGMIVAITVALYHLVRRLQGDFTLRVLFTFASLFSLLPIYTPRPWHFSILFFVLELDILMHARRTGKTRELAWLPLIFALWSNIHIEYIYGLFVLGLALVESVVARRWAGATVRTKPVWVFCALLASLLATLANPFGWRIYGVVYNLVTQGGGLLQVSEMQAIPFRGLANYCVLLLTLAAAGALAWTRRFRLFESGLFFFAAVLSFRSQRDVWLIAVVAAAIKPGFAITSSISRTGSITGIPSDSISRAMARSTASSLHRVIEASIFIARSSGANESASRAREIPPAIAACPTPASLSTSMIFCSSPTLIQVR